MLKLVYLLFFLAIVTQGCKLDPPEFYKPVNASPYYPLSAGTTWKYVLEYTDNEPDTTSLVITDDNVIINKQVYRKILSVSRVFGTTASYLHNANHVIILRQPTYVPGVYINMQIVNDSIPVGQGWTIDATDDGTIGGVPARLVGTVLETGITRQVGDINYGNVIHTRVELQYDEGEGFVTNTIYHFYVAMGVGLIETNASSGDLLSISSLLNYDVK